MTDDRIDAIEALLKETEAAHGAFEATELEGVYDEQWPEWYAAYAVDHGLGAVVGRSVTADEVAELLSTVWAEFKATDPPPPESWHRYVARHLAERLRT